MPEMTPDTTEALARNLRAKSDALLKRCGWKTIAAFDTNGDPRPRWFRPDGQELLSDYKPHPYANAQDAIDLAEAMGLRIMEISPFKIGDGYQATLWNAEGFAFLDAGPTIAEAICVAIEAALGDPA